MPNIPKALTYAIIIPLGDDDDYSKRMNIGQIGTTSYIIWYNEVVPGGTVSESIDLTDTDALGIYIQVSGATTISLEVKTAQSEDNSGWTVYDATVFTDPSGDYIFYNCWMLPFQTIRFVTSETVTISIQAFKKM